MKTLVTGATGFIGARLVAELLRRGEQVRILCRESSDTSACALMDVEVQRGSLDSEADLRAAMKDCRRVYHLAAFAAGWTRDEREAIRTNCDALRVLFDVALSEHVERVVYTSTIMTYGPSRGRVVTEKTLRAVPSATLYEHSKIESECIVNEALEMGLDVVTVHPTRVFGPGKMTEANSATIMIDKYIRGFWRTLPGDGSATGNYVYVDDVVKGCIAAMEQGRRGGHYILGGANLAYSELFASVGRVAGMTRRLVKIPRKVARVFAHVELYLGKAGLKQPAITPAWVDVFYDDWICSSALAEKELGYIPTPLDSALRETIDWLGGRLNTMEAES